MTKSKGDRLIAVRSVDQEKRYRAAIAKLHATIVTHPNALELECCLVRECETVRSLPAEDRFGSQRRADKEKRDRAPGIAKAATKVARYVRSFPHATGFQNMGAMIRLADQLDAFAKLARDPKFGRSGPFDWRTAVPGIVFDHPIDDGRHKKLIDLPTRLAFCLVMWCRCLTGADRIPQYGMPMPRAGRPLYDVVDEFVVAALGEERRISAKDRMRGTKGLQLGPWK
jgi:hypothetical protein